ncbi:TlyA family RNA methyltransferase [uncultured Faecalicoccus sp.]|uniref:TlyA family RNA methyltransferase n=1 Tax=uncultured Faecalicoccus sp. TaxID=1971760 RepID=UPI0025EEF81D|nr:TlyA family RNA methyltransferase [uncultured Faecalicoccus sp.]
MTKNRLDILLADEVSSRAKAQDLIKEGKVKVNGKTIRKPSTLVDPEDQIEVDLKDTYVSRGAYKLKACLEENQVRLDHQIVLDVGASTGGFTQVCLEWNASKVYSLDVGHFQLDPILEADHRVIKMEGRNGRYIEPRWFEDSIDFLCMDVSFISCKTILKPVLDQMEIRHCAILIKPQFECGPQYLNAKGVLKNKKIQEAILTDIQHFMFQYYEKIQITECPIKGRSGNQEFMLYADKRRGLS